MGAHSKRTTQRRRLRLLIAGFAAAGVMGGTALSVGALPISPGPLDLHGHRFNDGEYVDPDDLVHSPIDDGLEDEYVPDDDGVSWLPEEDSIVIYVDENGNEIGWHTGDGSATRLGPYGPSLAELDQQRLMTLHDYFTFDWNGRGFVG